MALPDSAISPTISCPRIIGRGAFLRPVQECTSDPQMVQQVIRTQMQPFSARGTGYSMILKSAPGFSITAALAYLGIFLPCRIQIITRHPHLIQFQQIDYSLLMILQKNLKFCTQAHGVFRRIIEVSINTMPMTVGTGSNYQIRIPVLNKLLHFI